MPKIKNKKYLVFFDDWAEWTPLSLEDFKIALDKIEYKDKHKTKQVKYFFTIAYYTGLRPEEIVTLKPSQIDKLKRKAILLKLQALKKGKSGTIALPLNELTDPIFIYAKQLPPGLNIFWTLNKASPNKVKYIGKEEQQNGTKIKIEKTKIYTRHSRRINYISLKWFGWPCYYFRHNRLAHARRLGATGDDLLELKLGSDLRSVKFYTKFGTVDAINKLKYLKNI